MACFDPCLDGYVKLLQERRRKTRGKSEKAHGCRTDAEYRSLKIATCDS